jgi:hypothetical protein
MHTNVFSVLVSMDAFDEAEVMYRQTIARFASTLPGFQGMMGLVDTETGEVLSVALNDTETGIMDARESEINQEEIGKFQHLFLSDPQREAYRMEVRYLPLNRPFPGDHAFYARVTTGWVKPSNLNKLVTFSRDSLIYAAIFEKGCAGFLLCSNRKTGKVFGMSMWESLEHLLFSESDEGYYHREMAKTGDMVLQPTERRIYRVFHRLMPKSASS